MKKVLFLLLTVITVCSCYNDDDLWDKVNDLDGRVETLETTVKGMNSDITALQNLVDALNQGKVIINTEQTSEGYTLTFNDGSKVSIKNGTNGTDAPVIGIKADEDGTYYWTITTNGVTDWLPDADNKLKVTGTTPIMGVDDDGYWTVDTGDGAQPINGADGKPIKAKGEDGDSFFKSVTVNDNYVLVTLADGTSFTLPKGETYTFDIANRDYTLFSSNETRTYLLRLSGVSSRQCLFPIGIRYGKYADCIGNGALRIGNLCSLCHVLHSLSENGCRFLLDNGKRVWYFHPALLLSIHEERKLAEKENLNSFFTIFARK